MYFLFFIIYDFFISLYLFYSTVKPVFHPKVSKMKGLLKHQITSSMHFFKQSPSFTQSLEDEVCTVADNIYKRLITVTKAILPSENKQVTQFARASPPRYPGACWVGHVTQWRVTSSERTSRYRSVSSTPRLAPATRPRRNSNSCSLIPGAITLCAFCPISGRHHVINVTAPSRGSRLLLF